MEEHMLTCSYKSTFGVECLGCGTQRSIYALFQGDIIDAFIMNPGVPLFILTVLIGGYMIYRKSRFIAATFITGVSLTVLGMIVKFTFTMIQ